MFGNYDVPVNIAQEGISLSIQTEGGSLRYIRECLGEKVEKIILTNSSKILINPIEPLSKPKELTPYLLIELGNALVVEPKATQKVFMKFPIEIGVFISKDGDLEILDVFTLLKPKFTLYGDPRIGFICKYFKSDVYPSVPAADCLHEGVIELNITNTTTSWIEVTKAIFNAYGMKIYYNDNLVSMRANMKVKGAQIAESDFIDSPFETEMRKSLELYAVRKLSIASTKSVMELGL